MGRFSGRAAAGRAALMGLLVAGMWAGAARAREDEPPAQEAPGNAWQIDGVVVGTYQHTGQSDARDDWGLSADIAAQLKVGPGVIGAEMKGNTTPRRRGVTGILGEANDTMGETLDRSGYGRAAIVQLYYSLPVAAGTLTVGLLDSTANIDGNSIADTEYTDFMGSSFVHNPTIQFPSFALGASYLLDFNDAWHLEFLLSSTAGLEDQPTPRYSHVFSPFTDDQGPFGAIELQTTQPNGIEAGLGIWANASANARLRSGAGDETNYGAYTNVVGPIVHRADPDMEPKYSIRLGIARKSVSPARDFEALAFNIPFGGDTSLGIGIGRTGASADLAASRSLLQAEAYFKFPVWKMAERRTLYLAPDVQYLRHSNFDPGIDSAWVIGARLGYEFCFAAQKCTD